MSDSKLEQPSFQLPSDGYQVISFLSEESVKNISAYYNENQHVDQERGFHSTMHQRNLNYRKQVYNYLKNETKKIVQSVLPHYEVLIANYVVKNTGLDSDVGLHADWSYVDESKSRSLNLWCPLVNTNKMNGRINVCPRTHIRPEPYRGTPFIPFSDELTAQYTSSAVGLNLKAGNAVLYDSSLIHFSDNNKTDEQRLAIALVMIPQKAQAIHCYHTKKEVCIFNVDNNFFLRHEIGKRPSGEPNQLIPYQESVIKKHGYR